MKKEVLYFVAEIVTMIVEPQTLLYKTDLFLKQELFRLAHQFLVKSTWMLCLSNFQFTTQTDYS
jgi:hypothetical protein